MNCDCATEVDARLKSENLRLVGYALVAPDYKSIPYIQTEWINRDKAPKGRKRNPTYMLASHCPFCGKATK